MQFDKHMQWIGAVYAANLDLMKDMLKEDRTLANFTHEAFDDPYRPVRLPVATLLFAVAGATDRPACQERRINFEMVKLLMKAGADPNIYSVHGRPLCAVRDEHLAHYLIDHGADIDLWHGNGGSPLNFAVRQMDSERLGMLLRLGADPYQVNPEDGSSMLHTAAATLSNDMNLADHLNIIRMLGDAGVDPNGRTDGYVHSRKKTIGQEDTPLHTAAVGNMAAAVKTLLDIGCDPTVTNAKGETPLAVARRVHRDDEITSLLTF